MLSYFISNDETLIVFDDSITLVETKKFNTFISNKFLKSFSFWSYLLFKLNYYDEKTDGTKLMKIVLVGHNNYKLTLVFKKAF